MSTPSSTQNGTSTVRLLFDPNTESCPDFASEEFADIHNTINANDQTAIDSLVAAWTKANDKRKKQWEEQVAADKAAEKAVEEARRKAAEEEAAEAAKMPRKRGSKRKPRSLNWATLTQTVMPLPLLRPASPPLPRGKSKSGSTVSCGLSLPKASPKRLPLLSPPTTTSPPSG
jgi:hypothetical protein